MELNLGTRVAFSLAAVSATLMVGGCGGEDPQTQETVGEARQSLVTTWRVRVHVYKVDSGFDAAAMTSEIAAANAQFAPAGLQLDFDPTTDVSPNPGVTGPCASSLAQLTSVGNATLEKIPVFFCKNDPGSEASFTENWVRWNGAPGLLSHELGHYFGLKHTFGAGWVPEDVDVAEAQAQVKPPDSTVFRSIESCARAILDGTPLPSYCPTTGWNSAASFRDLVLDGDKVPDTGISLHVHPSRAPAACTPSLVIPLTVHRAGGVTTSLDFTPARNNPMGYYGCPAIPRAYSSQQNTKIQLAFMTGVRSHLLAPKLTWAVAGQVAGTTGQPLGMTTFDNRLYMFASGNVQTHSIFVNSAPVGQAFGGWGAIGGLTDVALGAVDFDQKLYAFAKGDGANHSIYFNYAQAQQPFVGWAPLGGATDRAISATKFDSRIYLFAKGDTGNNNVYFNHALAQQPFAGWVGIGGQTDEAIASTVFDNRLNLIIKTVGQNLYSMRTALAQQPFSASAPITSTIAPGITPVGAMATTSFAGHLFIVARGSDSNVYYAAARPQQPFGSWNQIPGISTNVTPAAATFNNRIFVAVKTAGNQVWIASASSP